MTELDGPVYHSYLYAYPHKTAYRPLAPPVPLRDLWAAERRDALFLYVHVPFCEMRCGFCNLFTAAKPPEELVPAWLAALRRQAERVSDALGERTFARLAIGGGTPTLLDERSLDAVFDLAERTMGVDLARAPISVETSPETAFPSRLRVLAARGVSRVSIGVQSFVDAECRAVNRPQKSSEVHAALDAIRATGVPTLNVDLMYGLPGQTAATWRGSLESALRYRPEELYLYPLYVRALTTLGRKSVRAEDEARLALYRLGRDLLVSRGYRQVSMRMFRAPHAPAQGGPVYCCQEDGMVGLGVGARSYTAGLHYGTEYAVGARGVRDILGAWVERSGESFAVADWGIRLDEGERRRRHVILSLLSDEGLDLDVYARRFGTAALDDLPQLAELAPRGLAAEEGGVLRLTPAGLERADAIGPWLVSPRVRSLMEGASLR